MRLWGKSGRAGSAVESLVGEQTELLGDVRFAGGLHVDGRIKGRVLCSDDEGSLSVGAAGLIEGSVGASRVVINGQVIGDVHARRVAMGPKARVLGNVYYSVVEMAPGAKVLGQLILQDEAQPVAALTHQPGSVSKI